jgi:curved DNA-binding protein CbpA
MTARRGGARGAARGEPAQASLGAGVDHDPLSDDLYERLQVSPRATLAVIRAAYRALARDYHPDVNSTPEAARYMRHLNEAYDVLSDSTRRARYQRRHEQSARSSAGGATARTARPTRSHRAQRQYQPAPSRGLHVERSFASWLLVRGAVAGLMVAATVLVIVFLWIALVDGDDYTPPGTSGGFGRGGIPGLPASTEGGFRMCGPSRILPLSC